MTESLAENVTEWYFQLTLQLLVVFYGAEQFRWYFRGIDLSMLGGHFSHSKIPRRGKNTTKASPTRPFRLDPAARPLACCRLLLCCVPLPPVLREISWLRLRWRPPPPAAKPSSPIPTHPAPPNLLESKRGRGGHGDGSGEGARGGARERHVHQLPPPRPRSRRPRLSLLRRRPRRPLPPLQPAPRRAAPLLPPLLAPRPSAVR